MASESTLSSTFAYLPKEKISKGDSYTNSITLKEMFGMEIVSKYTVASVSGKTIDLNLFSDISFAPKEPIAQNGINMNIKATGNQNGTFSINKSDGMATASEMSQVMDMTMSMKNPQNGQDMMIPMKVKTIVKSTVSKN